MYKETFFSIDSYDIYYKGYTDGAHWNGWECPRFTKEVADQVTEWFNRPEDNMPAWYDVDKDAYIFTMDPDGDEVEDFEGVDIEFEGKTLHVYPIGAWCWVWDAYTQEEIDKLHEPEDEDEEIVNCPMDLSKKDQLIKVLDYCIGQAEESLIPILVDDAECDDNNVKQILMMEDLKRVIAKLPID